MRPLIRIGCLSLLILGVVCGTAIANTRTGNQNPDLVVTASIGPNHLDVGERSFYSTTVTNTTDHPIRVRVTIEFKAPFTGFGEGIEGTLDPGQSIDVQRSFRARTGGRYTLSIRARDVNGVSHTHASAVA